MRKILISLLMAGVAMPVAATAKERGDFVGAIREQAAEARQKTSSEDPPQRAERSNRSSERAVRSGRPDRSAPTERTERTEQSASETNSGQQQQQVVRSESHQRVRNNRRSADNLADGFRAVAQEQQTQSNVGVHRGTDGSFTGRRSVERHDGTSDRNHRWSSDWRRDHRYDWRNYRNSHRSVFRIGRYYDPYGWGYRRFSVGYNLWPSYYGSNFWLNDPWMYRLPPAYGPYRWVRYFDDALLVNIHTGQVVDVLNNFFW